jgi:hypothetical protein
MEKEKKVTRPLDAIKQSVKEIEAQGGVLPH